jgi:exodeoxyribonuclease VII large subunit
VLVDRQNQLDRLRIRCERVKPDRQLELEADRLKGLQHRLRRTIAGRLQSAQKEQLHLREKCQALDPRLVLQRGYALVRQNNGEIVRNTDRLEIGAELSVQFGKGQANLRVVEIDGGKKAEVELRANGGTSGGNIRSD